MHNVVLMVSQPCCVENEQDFLYFPFIIFNVKQSCTFLLLLLGSQLLYSTQGFTEWIGSIAEAHPFFLPKKYLLNS